MRTVALFVLAACSVPAQVKHGPYEITLRLPEGGLFSQEEMHIEIKVADTRKEDPLMGFAPVVRAQIASVIDMPSMASMPKIEEIAHPEGIPGEYGIHPTFVHGGSYRLRLAITPPGGEKFDVEFPLEAGDARPVSARKLQRYRLEVSGKPEDLILKIIGSEGVVTDFDTVHERQFHLIAIRKDLAVFEHVHPEYAGGGTFRLKHAWPAGGDYTLFADVAPKGRGSHILSAKLKVKGPSAAPPSTSPLTVTPGGLPQTGKTAVLELAVPPSIPLEPYLGAMAHLLIVHADGETLVHSHPLEDSSSKFLVRLPKPGAYRAWLEVQSAGKVIVTPFALTAK